MFKISQSLWTRTVSLGEVEGRGAPSLSGLCDWPQLSSIARLGPWISPLCLPSGESTYEIWVLWRSHRLPGSLRPALPCTIISHCHTIHDTSFPLALFFNIAISPDFLSARFIRHTESSLSLSWALLKAPQCSAVWTYSGLSGHLTTKVTCSTTDAFLLGRPFRDLCPRPLHHYTFHRTRGIY